MINVFAGNPLDRAANQRRDAAWLGDRLQEPGTRFLLLRKLNALVTDTDKPEIAWQPATVVAPFLGDDSKCVFLGLEGEAARFAIDVSRASDDENVPPFTELGQFGEVRALGSLVPLAEAGIIAQARALIDWHNRHTYCAVCGATTIAVEGGYQRNCTAPTCAAQHFPRTDPVVITLIRRPGVCLLGRSARFPTDLYSCLAGFMEPGESIEEAVRREVLEECGIAVGAVRYHSSQPWPFPASLMIGCIGEGESEQIERDPVEIEDANWFTRTQVVNALNGGDPETGLKIPPSLAIAHQLIRWWVDDEASRRKERLA